MSQLRSSAADATRWRHNQASEQNIPVERIATAVIDEPSRKTSQRSPGRPGREKHRRAPDDHPRLLPVT